MESKEPMEIVITGGPCGGKSSAMSYLSRKLTDFGCRVFVASEIATEFITGGLHDLGDIAANNRKLFVDIETEILRYQLRKRKSFKKLAGLFGNQKPVVLYDRGPMDVMSYIGPKEFERVCKRGQYSLHELRDSFAGVIHLITAADGAEKFYTTANNEARRESAEEAKALDMRTLQAWVGHPHLRSIDNSTDFEGKLRRTLQAACRIVGIPSPLEIERKFLLKGQPDFTLPEFRHAVGVEIEQMYLSNPKGVRIRKRTQGRSSTYYKTSKVEISPGVREEVECFISPEEYASLSRFRDPDTRIILKSRYCFFYKNQYFELDVFKKPSGLCLLEIELTELGDRVELPPFLGIESEVTNTTRYSNSHIVRKGWKK